jgi:hypothetical protein
VRGGAGGLRGCNARSGNGGAVQCVWSVCVCVCVCVMCGESEGEDEEGLSWSEERCEDRVV